MTKLIRSVRARSGNKVYRNGMNSRAGDYGWYDSSSPIGRRRYKLYASKVTRKNARAFCRAWLVS